MFIWTSGLILGASSYLVHLPPGKQTLLLDLYTHSHLHETDHSWRPDKCDDNVTQGCLKFLPWRKKAPVYWCCKRGTVIGQVTRFDRQKSRSSGLIHWGERSGCYLVKCVSRCFCDYAVVSVSMVIVFIRVVCMCGNGAWSDLLINGQCVYVWKRSWSCFHANEEQQMGERSNNEQTHQQPHHLKGLITPSL